MWKRIRTPLSWTKKTKKMCRPPSCRFYDDDGLIGAILLEREVINKAIIVNMIPNTKRVVWIEM